MFNKGGLDFGNHTYYRQKQKTKKNKKRPQNAIGVQHGSLSPSYQSPRFLLHVMERLWSYTKHPSLVHLLHIGKARHVFCDQAATKGFLPLAVTQTTGKNSQKKKKGRKTSLVCTMVL